MTVLNREKVLDNVAIGNLVQLEAKEYTPLRALPCCHVSQFPMYDQLLFAVAGWRPPQF